MNYDKNTEESKVFSQKKEFWRPQREPIQGSFKNLVFRVFLANQF